MERGPNGENDRRKEKKSRMWGIGVVILMCYMSDLPV